MKKILIPLLLLVIALPVAAQFTIDPAFTLGTISLEPLDELMKVVYWVLFILFLLSAISFVSGLIALPIIRSKYRKVSQGNPAEILPSKVKTKEQRISQLLRFGGLILIFGTTLAVRAKLDECGHDGALIGTYEFTLYAGIALFVAGVVTRFMLARKSLLTSDTIESKPDTFDSLDSYKRYYRLHILHRLYTGVAVSGILLLVLTLIVWLFISFSSGEGCGFDVTM